MKWRRRITNYFLHGLFLSKKEYIYMKKKIIFSISKFIRAIISVALTQRAPSRQPEWMRTFTGICVHSVAISASPAADSSLGLPSSSTVSENKLVVLPSFHVTTMSPVLDSLTSPFDGEDFSSCIVLFSDASGMSSSLAVDTPTSSSPSLLRVFAAAALYFAISLLFLNEEMQKSISWSDADR